LKGGTGELKLTLRKFLGGGDATRRQAKGLYNQKEPRNQGRDVGGLIKAQHNAIPGKGKRGMGGQAQQLSHQEGNSAEVKAQVKNPPWIVRGGGIDRVPLDRGAQGGIIQEN